MSKLGLAFAVGAAFLCAGALTVRAASPSGLRTLQGHAVPAIVSQLQAKGAVPANQTMHLAIGLPLRNTNEMAELLQQVYDPASTNYHRFLTPAEFTARFGPTKQDYLMVENFARVSGFTITGTHPNRMLLDVSGPASAVEKAFHVMLRTYQHPTENRQFYAPDTEPTLQAALPILHVSGLNNYFTARPRIKSQPQAQPAGGRPEVGSAPGGSYAGNDFRNAYVSGTSLNGAGQSVGLFQLDGFYPSDVTAYENLIGLNANRPNLVVVPVDGGVPAPTPFGNPEVSLDIDMVLSMSPGVSDIYVYEGPNFSTLSIYTIFEDVFNRMANDDLAKQLSCSWYIVNGQPDPVAEQIFQQMALQGQSLFAASGDSDAYPGFIAFPSDSPHITLVGGTTLSTGRAASYTSETVWNWGVEYGIDGVGSSGGISTTYSIPTWQKNINFTTSHGSSTMRNVPDVALTADNVWVIYGGGQGGIFGGTSAAAPLWAGFTALVNQQAALKGHAPVGFLNPGLYAIANSANYTNCFHDIVTGNNEWSGSPDLFVATNNYDLCTGLGTPNGTNLINALTVAALTNAIAHLSPPPPPYGSQLAQLNGGNPNGTWQLFVLDDALFNGGMVSNGWSITLTTANPVGFSADVAVGMTPAASTILVSNVATFTLTVTNYGPSTSSNVLVADTLPQNSVFISATPDEGTVTRSGQLIQWNVGTLAVNTGSKLVLVAQPSGTGSFLNYAQVNAGTPDANSADDFAMATVSVISPTPPVFSSMLASTNGMFQLAVSSPALPTIIQASTNLVDWVGIYTNTPPFTFSDSNATNYPLRFYRAVTP